MANLNVQFVDAGTNDNLLPITVLGNISDLETKISGGGLHLSGGILAVNLGTGLSNVSGAVTLDKAGTASLGGVIVGSNLSVDGNGVLSIADATSSVKGVVQKTDYNGIVNSTSANPGGVPDAYAVKLYVQEAFDSADSKYVILSNCPTDLTPITGTGSGGGDNPATAWAVKSYVDSGLSGKQATLSSANAGTNISIGTGGVINCTYTLPTATTASLGGVTVSSHLSTDPISVDEANVESSISVVASMYWTAKGFHEIAEQKQDKLTKGNGINITTSGGSTTIANAITGGFGIDVTLGATNTIAKKRFFDIENVSGSSVSVQAGHGYKAVASSGAFTINAEACGANQFGLEGHIQIFISGTGYVQTGANIVLKDSLIGNSVNNCTVRFHSGTAILSLEDHIGGYIVTLGGSTTGNGSLPYGLTSGSSDFVTFSATTDNSPITLSAVTTSGSKHVIGNEFATIITGSMNGGTTGTTFYGVSFNDLTISGGTVSVESGKVVENTALNVTGGSFSLKDIVVDGELNLDVEPTILANANITGNGVVDLANISINVLGGNAVINDVEVTGGNYGVNVGANCTASMAGVTLSGNTSGGFFVHSNGTAAITNGSVYDYSNVELGGVLNLHGHCYVRDKIEGNGVVNISDGTIIDFTGNTESSPIVMGSGVEGDEGKIVVTGSCTVITSGGTSVTVSGGTYYAINNDSATPTSAQAPYVYGYKHVITMVSGTSASHTWAAIELTNLSKSGDTWIGTTINDNNVTHVTAKMACHFARIGLMDNLTTRHIKYYVNPNNITKKLDGTDAILTGEDGEVMTEFPESHYLRMTQTSTNVTTEYVLMSRSKFGYNDYVSDYFDSFKISPNGDTVRKQYMGYYQAVTQTLNIGGTNKTCLRSISDVYPTVSTSLNNYLTYAENYGGSVCNEAHYEWLFHLFITQKISAHTQGISLGFSMMNGWDGGWVRKTGRTNILTETDKARATVGEVSPSAPNIYGGEVMADDTNINSPDYDLKAFWQGSSITANSKNWTADVADSVKETVSEGMTSRLAFSVYSWKNGSDHLYTKKDYTATPQATTPTFTDKACTINSGYPVTAYNAPTATNKVIACKYFIENPWGSIWQNLTGMLPIIGTVGAAGKGYWKTLATSLYKTLLTYNHNSSPATGITWVSHDWPASGYPTTWNNDTFLPLTVGTVTGGFNDYIYNSDNVNPRAGFRGGGAHTGSYDGLGSVAVSRAVGHDNASLGARLSA